MSRDAVAMSYPLSPMQQGMLFHHVSDRHSGVDIQQIVCTLSEALEEGCFRDAWSRVVARHTALRTSFRWEQVDQPIQVVRERVDLPVSFADWRGLEATEQGARLEAFLDADRRRGFEAAQAPLLRVACFRLEEARAICVWTFHHLVCDGESCASVLREVFAAYEALRHGVEPRFGPTSPYAEFIRWLGGRDRVTAERFWRETLQGFRAATSLPGLERPGRAARAGAAGECRSALSATVTSALNELASRHHISLSTVLQGAWAIVLSRYSRTDDVVFGVTRAGRGTPGGVGVFINTLPARVRVRPDVQIIPWLQELRAQQVASREVEYLPLAEVQRLSDVPPGVALFGSLFIFDRQSLDTALRSLGGSWVGRQVRVVEKTGLPLTFYAYGEPECLLKIAYDEDRFARGTAERMLAHLRTVLEALAANPDRSVGQLPPLPDAERRQQLVEWNATAAAYPSERCVHALIEEQVDRAPDAVALVCHGDEVTYRELDARANRLAHHLRTLGVGPEVLVGICVDRSIDMVAGVLAILKAGGAYVPLDPSYPRERLRLILEDSGVRVIVTHRSLEPLLPEHGAAVVRVDAERNRIARQRAERLASGVTGANLAYVIYTSGSTGRPKGVMVEHRNVANLFAGMDERLARPAAGVWLAVTSLSFDIAVLELLWPLARGFKVVLATDELARAEQGTEGAAMQFSLFYFATDEGKEQGDKYRLLLEGARFADEHGFTAVWTPERHFHAFGGVYPNPAITSAAIAAITKRVKIRGGSCVLPLHHPARVAEDWSVVDNLSNGRVGIAFASGWQPNDFVLMPGNYTDAEAVMRHNLEIVRRLWRGEAVAFAGPTTDVEVRTLPRPVQPELPCWITAAGNPETFRRAGEMGAYVLTHLLGQSVEEVAGKLELYRRAWREAGHPGRGHVTLMLHTFVGDDVASVRAEVREPLRDYLRSAADLMQQVATRGLPPEDMEALLDHSFDRYFETSALLGTPATCLAMVRRLQSIGVDEIACLIDFGVPSETVLRHLPHLEQLRQAANGVRETSWNGDGTIAGLIKRYGVTHLQCTPSWARLLMEDPEAREALRSLHRMLVGGEVLPTPLASDLRSLVGGDVINMYGPTETTVWSSAHAVTETDAPIPIGRPIANTELYILDDLRRPVPVGVPGELFIGGHGVARGYWHDPELTAQRFERHPFKSDPAARVFRTGDLARYRDDGCIEFLGRTDHQVKLRGHRIELGEIERVLGRCPGVQQAVAVAREGPNGPMLVAYYVPAPGGAPTDGDLQRYLGQQLPSVMIPSVFVALPTLPLTPNGKVDRSALPLAGVAGSQTADSHVAPHSPIELALARIWKEVLGTERVGVHDNFFELGGDSLSLIRVASRIHRALHVKLSLRAILDAPTVAQLAPVIERLLSAPSGSGLGHDAA